MQAFSYELNKPTKNTPLKKRAGRHTLLNSQSVILQDFSNCNNSCNGCKKYTRIKCKSSDRNSVVVLN
jgi:hypothetical protein